MPVPSAGTPNVLVVLHDDVGRAAWSPYGGRIDMPTMGRLARNGLIHGYRDASENDSPTRAAAVLRDAGWSTCWVGDHFDDPADPVDLIAPKKSRSSRLGFDRVYDFLGCERNGALTGWDEPSHLLRLLDHSATVRRSASEIADDAIEFLRDVRRARPLGPWYLCCSPGIGHASASALRSYLDKYRGRFDDGFDAYREWALDRMVQRGLLPAGSTLAPRGPIGDGLEGDHAQPRSWSSLSDRERRRLSRMAEEYAAMCEYTDVQMGRILDHVEQSGQLENTLIFYGVARSAPGDGSSSSSRPGVERFGGDPIGIGANLALLAELGSCGDAVRCPAEWSAAFALTPAIAQQVDARAHRSTEPPSILECCGLATQHPLDDLKQTIPHEAPSAQAPMNDVAIMRFTKSGEGGGAPVTGRYAFYPNSAKRRAIASSRTHGRTFKLNAEIEITGQAEGVICAQETRFGSYSLAVRKGKLVFDHGFAGISPEKRLECEMPATGRHVVGVEFTKHGKGRRGASAGAVTLYVDGEPMVGTPLSLMTGRFALCGEGLLIGREGGDPLVRERRASLPLVGAQVIGVVFDVAEEACADDEHEEAAATHG